jgi:cyclase
MLAKRIIACLDVRDGHVVKGVNFAGLREVGDPAALASGYAEAGIDEIVVLDVTATFESRTALIETIERVASTIFVPLTVGGGVRSVDDAARLVDAGADKISVNSAALRDPSLITRLADRFGRQAVVVAIDARKRVDLQADARLRGDFKVDARANGPRYDVLSRSGTTVERSDAVAWAQEAESRGAGEILLTSMDRDGTKRGFDCVLTASVSAAVGVPVIASGGGGTPEDFAAVLTTGRADAALAASIFHRGETSVGELKRYLADRGLPVRLESGVSC